MLWQTLPSCCITYSTFWRLWVSNIEYKHKMVYHSAGISIIIIIFNVFFLSISLTLVSSLLFSLSLNSLRDFSPFKMRQAWYVATAYVCLWLDRYGCVSNWNVAHYSHNHNEHRKNTFISCWFLFVARCCAFRDHISNGNGNSSTNTSNNSN